MPATLTLAPDPRRLLEQLDIPDCTCDEPHCPHLDQFLHDFDADTFPLTLDEWAELQRAVDPQSFSDPPLSPAPAVALSRVARVAVYEQRRAAGTGLWHRGDLWRHAPDTLSMSAHRQRNGVVNEDGVRETRRAAA